MQILSVSRKSKAVLLLLKEEGEEARRYGVSEAEYRTLGAPAAGEVLDGERLSLLLGYDERHRAKAAAVRILSFGDNNRATLARKLRARGFSQAVCGETVDAMVARGYIREGDQIERAVLLAARKLWGARRIVEALTARGFPREAVTEAVEALTLRGEIDFAANRRRLLEEKGKQDAPPAVRAAFLYRYGYSVGGETDE